MSSQSKRWFSREGFTADVVGRWLRHTLLAPSLTIPLLLLANFTASGKHLGQERPKTLKALKLLVTLGVGRWINRFINRRVLNNRLSDTYNWSQEVALVTGGSDGIGQRIALLLASRGVKVAVLDLQPLKYQPPAGSSIAFYRCDITSSEEVSRAAAEIRESIGEPTILINNAGIAKVKTVLEGTEEDTRQTFEVNTLSHYRIAREFLPHLISHNHGMVVTIASQAGYIITSHMVDYSASKAAAIAFHEGLTVELKTRYSAPRVRTVLVTQGFARTFLSRNLSYEDTWFNPLLEPDTVAKHLVQQILSGSSGHVVVPGSTGFIACNIRSFPHWFQSRIRNDAAKLMLPREGKLA